YDDAKKNCDAFSNLKHNNFLPYTMAALHAKKQKWNDAVVLNSQGSVCDSSIANIFLVKDGLIHTSSLAEGCIAGILRRTILQQFAAGNRQVIEGKISVDDLINADEVFLTNSIYNIRWVQSIGEKKYGNILTQKIYAEVLPTIS
ncbi:MAG TPA: aminotransferase class IV, partial [Ferruginibacter sp.]|nr:aminotransferase class IV [Ferruginibacter sp.]